VYLHVVTMYSYGDVHGSQSYYIIVRKIICRYRKRRKHRWTLTPMPPTRLYPLDRVTRRLLTILYYYNIVYDVLYYVYLYMGGRGRFFYYTIFLNTITHRNNTHCRRTTNTSKGWERTLFSSGHVPTHKYIHRHTRVFTFIYIHIHYVLL